MSEKPRLSLGDVPSLVYAVSRAGLALSWSVCSGWARGDAYPPEYRRHVMYSVGRDIFGQISPLQIQAALGTSGDGYNAYVKKHRIEPAIVALGAGASGLCFGPADAPTTLLWFHGGGYAFPATEPHFELAQGLIRTASGQGKSIRVMLLQYDLAPRSAYPVQLKQAVAALTHLLATALSPSQILLGGDSAGGNLACALLGHLSHPKDGVPTLDVPTSLGGVILVSPWITFDQDAPAFTRNKKKDGIDGVALRVWSDNFMASAPRDNYNSPKDAPADWWKGIKTSTLAVVAGQNEILVDDIRALADSMKVHFPTLEYCEVPGEAHDAIVLDRSLGIWDELASESFIRQWALARLK